MQIRVIFALPSLVPPPLVPWAAAADAYPSIHHCCTLGIWHCLLRLNPKPISQLVVSSFGIATALPTEVSAITMITARKIQTLFAYYVQISTKIS